jgi:hypothetical protein
MWNCNPKTTQYLLLRDYILHGRNGIGNKLSISTFTGLKDWIKKYKYKKIMTLIMFKYYKQQKFRRTFRGRPVYISKPMCIGLG